MRPSSLRLPLSIIVILLLTGVTTAQVADQFSIGPRIGINIANVSNVDNTDALVGLVAGLTSTYSFSETSGVTVDLLYSGEGYTSSGGNDIKTAYLQIPIYYDVFFGQLGQPLRPKVYVGVVPSFLLSAKNEDIDIKDNFNGFNFGLSGGLGVNYRLASRVWLNADLRAILGITDLRDEEFQDDDQVASRNIQISLGVAYGLSRID